MFMQRFLGVAMGTGTFALVLSGCVDPGASPAEPAEVEEAEASPTAEAAEAPPAAEARTELTPDDPIAAYRGPRIGIQASPDGLAPSTPIRLTLSVTSSEGQPIELDEATSVQWRIPEGWTVEGEGTSVTVTPPAVLPAGEVDIGVRVERPGQSPVRGGILLRAPP